MPDAPDEFDMIAVQLGSEMLNRGPSDSTRGRAFGDFLITPGYTPDDLIDMFGFDEDFTATEGDN